MFGYWAAAGAAGILAPIVGFAWWIPRRFLFEVGLGNWPLFRLPIKDEIALTFDDGPEPAHTIPLLDILDSLHVTATFFIGGKKAARHPEIVRDIRSRGHVVGCHGMTHIHLACRSRETYMREIRDSTRRIEDTVGEPISLFRPPYGIRCPRLYRAMRKQGLRPVFWSNMAYDWRRTTPDRITASIVNGIRGGDLVLLHDGGGPRTPTVQAIPFVVENLREAGYRLVSI